MKRLLRLLARFPDANVMAWIRILDMLFRPGNRRRGQSRPHGGSAPGRSVGPDLGPFGASATDEQKQTLFRRVREQSRPGHRRFRLAGRRPGETWSEGERPTPTQPKTWPPGATETDRLVRRRPMQSSLRNTEDRAPTQPSPLIRMVGRALGGPAQTGPTGKSYSSISSRVRRGRQACRDRAGRRR